MRDIKVRQKQIWIVIISILIIALMAWIINAFILRVQKNQQEIAESNLLVAANNGAAMIAKTIESYIGDLETIALLIEKQENLKSDETIALLKEIADLKGYERLAIEFEDGTSYTSDGHILDVSSQGYLSYIQNKQPYITDVLSSIIDGLPTIGFLIPLHTKEGMPAASIRLAMRTDRLGEEIDLDLFDEEGYYHLVDKKGKYVALGESENALLMDENYFDAIRVLKYKEGYSKEGIMQTFLDGVPAYSKYSVDTEERIAYCQPAVNNWVLMTIVSEEVITKQAGQNISFAITMTIELAVILTIIFIFLYIQQNKAKQEVELSGQCFRALTEQTGKLIFDFDYKDGKLASLNNFNLLTGSENAVYRTPQESIGRNMIYEEDVDTFLQMYEELHQGKNIKDIKIRMRHKDETFHWCLFSIILIKDAKGKIRKAIGSIEDINDSVKKEENLIRNSERDQLTGMFNKATTEKMIIKELKAKRKEDVYALMLIDIDDFKKINDSLGHQYGDMVLKDLAHSLIDIVGKEILIGRIGGDEFFVFIKNYKTKSEVKAKAAHICDMFRKTYVEGGVECKVSASVGICFVPEHGTEFEDIYQQADIALYRTKEQGKNNYTVYDGVQVHSNYISNRTKIDE